ncbi:MAG: c-type cytochrome [Verrucomicrobia bacterium]|nr:c-type cytochrome [Verrucomicrobiota bacterium]
MHSVKFFALSLAALLAATGLHAADPFAENVRTTEPLTPEQQQKTFHLPPGFEIQLVAVEPDLRKPMNMAFDALGRLWITESREYPFFAPLDKPARDSIRIFSDFDENGRARKVTIFADGLNIPIGLYPFCTPNADGKLTWKCIAWSIPHIWLFEDADGDGKADKREPLYGPFDHTRDTHGNQASFKRGFDGWLYATHGYSNDSHVKGRDGHEIHLNSGNTYRLRLDGARLEQHTWGQVNPFGTAWDPLGNLYSSDCHSAPTYQLLAGGYYPSFGKPHDGLGFAPVLMEHSHGSTAIDGMVYYADDLWPAEFHGNIFVGNVMTSRSNRDRLEFHGSSPQAIELDDFVKTDDPWFRPVDQQLGPDGAFYIADFYNRIIGHYEVPLQHPGRDRERGRLWRVVYKGADGQAKLRPRALPQDLNGLIGELASPNLPRRMLALDTLLDRFGRSSEKALLKAFQRPANAFQKVQALWGLNRLDALDDARLLAAAKDRDALVRTHAMRVVAERGRLAERLKVNDVIRHGFTKALPDAATAGLRDSHALVQRCAAEALSATPHFANVRPLLDLRAKVPPADTHLLYVVRKAIRDQLKDDAVFAEVAAAQWSTGDIRTLADVALAVKSETAGAFLLRHLDALQGDREVLSGALQHAAQFAPAGALESIATFTQRQFRDDLDFQLALFANVEQGASRRGARLTDSLRAWGTELCKMALAASSDSAWWNAPLEGVPDAANPWAFQERACADGQSAKLLSSHPLGETLTGRLRSKNFTLPVKLSFYLSGHDGEPGREPNKRNFARLLHAQTGAVLAEAAPPRNDTAQKITWDMSAHAGQQAFLEFTDGDPDDAWAWLAFGRFEPPVLALPTIAPGAVAKRQQAAAEILARQRFPLQGRLRELVSKGELDAAVRAAVGAALAVLDPEGAVPLLGPLLGPAQPAVVQERVGLALAEMGSEAARMAVLAAMKSAPQRLQLSWARALAASPAGADALLNAAASSQASPRLLQDRAVRDKILAARPGDAAARVAALTKDLPPTDRERERLIRQRGRAYAVATAKSSEGLRVFQQNCAPCHQIDGQGGLIGPQLDGIGNRGLERLLEDVLDPNRNVDRAFYTTVLTQTDDEIVSGLFRREEGELIVLANSAGQEFSVPKRSVKERQESQTSLMPDNFGEIITPEDANHLLAFLLSKSGSPPAK